MFFLGFTSSSLWKTEQVNFFFIRFFIVPDEVKALMYFMGVVQQLRKLRVGLGNICDEPYCKDEGLVDIIQAKNLSQGIEPWSKDEVFSFSFSVFIHLSINPKYSLQVMT